MRTLIVGGSRGIGASLYHRFSQIGPVVVTNSDIDITTETGREVLLLQMEQSDIIISNAYAGSGQRDLLLCAFDSFKDTDKIYVNMESVNAWREGILTKGQIEYATDKLALVATRKHLQKHPRRMAIIGVCPATVDTEFNRRKTIPKLSLEQVTTVIHDAVKMAIDGVEIAEIHFATRW